MEKNKKNVYDYILNLCKGRPTAFGSNDHKRPFLQKDHVISTNGFILVRMPKTLPGGEYQKGDLKVQKVLDEFDEESKQTIAVSSLLGMLTEYGLFLDRKEKCKECNGSGEDVCDSCDREMECDVCLGAGFVDSERTLSPIKFTKFTIEVGGFKYTPDYLHMVALTAALLGVDEIDMRIDSKRSKLRVDVGEVQILLMLQK